MTHPSLFAPVEMAPRDPILGLTESFVADTRPNKVNLGVGVYYTNEGKVPLLRAVQETERKLVSESKARSYLPIDGIAGYNKGVQTLLFGADSPVLAQKRAITAQTLGGTGGLRVGADLLKRLQHNAVVAISDPSWENHHALFEAAGFPVQSYRYYDAATHGLDFPGMLASLKALPAQSVVVLHACCHNPTGVDLTAEQWKQVVELVKERELVPFVDIAYQGFAESIEPDAAVVRLFAASGLSFVVSSSFSKSFSLYGERVGAVTFVTANEAEGERVLSLVKRVIRTNYSNPPTHGGSVVSAVLNSPELRAMWEAELGEMRDRIKLMRNALVEKLAAAGAKQDFSFVKTQCGMFSYSGLTEAQVNRLREEFAIYAICTGRICVAALNTGNIDNVAASIAKVL
ncbi:MAG: aspartate/tyrosine/aromatic aminotransferase [Candidatus Protistobacter heckmanni]|nr:aspartate/tyrosine/aromatic aminotransferase [Candidatus Protistobacter heckmanni]